MTHRPQHGEGTPMGSRVEKRWISPVQSKESTCEGEWSYNIIGAAACESWGVAMLQLVKLPQRIDQQAKSGSNQETEGQKQLIIRCVRASLQTP